MADCNRQAKFVSQLLQCYFPQPQPTSVASASISRDQQFGRPRIHQAAHFQPPAAIEFNEDSHIWALFPHTHLRGKSWEYRLVYPDGRSEVVLSVPKYDFNWQTYYVYAKPLPVPKGTRLEATAHYDNSTANPWNPDPKAAVRWGEQTWEEMQYSGITYSVDSQRRQSEHD